jgi:hypothetical protein
MTKRNLKTKAGLQHAKGITDSEFAKELTKDTNKKVEKTNP